MADRVKQAVSGHLEQQLCQQAGCRPVCAALVQVWQHLVPQAAEHVRTAHDCRLRNNCIHQNQLSMKPACKARRLRQRALAPAHWTYSRTTAETGAYAITSPSRHAPLLARCEDSSRRREPAALSSVCSCNLVKTAIENTVNHCLLRDQGAHSDGRIVSG